MIDTDSEVACTLNKVLCTTDYEYILITRGLLQKMVGWMELIYLGEFESMRWRIYSYPNRCPPLIEYPPITLLYTMY